MVEDAGNLLDSPSNIANKSIYSLKSLKINNQIYTVNLSAIYTLINDKFFFVN